MFDLFLNRAEQMTRQVWDYVFFTDAPFPKTDIPADVLEWVVVCYITYFISRNWLREENKKIKETEHLESRAEGTN